MKIIKVDYITFNFLTDGLNGRIAEAEHKIACIEMRIRDGEKRLKARLKRTVQEYKRLKKLLSDLRASGSYEVRDKKRPNYTKEWGIIPIQNN